MEEAASIFHKVSFSACAGNRLTHGVHKHARSLLTVCVCTHTHTHLYVLSCSQLIVAFALSLSLSHTQRHVCMFSAVHSPAQWAFSVTPSLPACLIASSHPAQICLHHSPSCLTPSNTLPHILPHSSPRGAFWCMCRAQKHLVSERCWKG